jgi:ABC-type nitrate/sulfonate/bicarbonate transport system substrate-binding protein
MEALRIGIINRTINMLDFQLAQEAGIYAAHGLQVSFDTLAGKESTDALAAGKLDVVVSIGAAARAIMTEDAPLKVALMVHRNAPHWLMAREGIATQADLRGRLVQAAQPGSEPDLMVRRWLTEGGLDPDRDVTLTYERAHPGWTEDGPSPREDAAIARTLEHEVLEARGFHTLLDLCERYPDTLVHGLVVTEAFVAQRLPALRALVAAHREVAAWIDEARPEAVAFIQERWKVSPERGQRACRSLNGRFVARLSPVEFGPVLAASARATGKPELAVERLITTAGVD